jgi:hypothetical protein
MEGGSLFDCFKNTFYENISTFLCPCLTYASIIDTHNKKTFDKTNKAICNSFSAGVFYCCLSGSPCIPGMYYRCLTYDGTFAAFLSYTCCTCCALLQDVRRVETNIV